MRFVGFQGPAVACFLFCSVAAHADVKAGVDAWDSGNFTKAAEIWRPLAVAGDADAQFNLAQAYRFGRGVPLDAKQAELWYRKAADQGHVQAEDNLGLIRFQNGDRAGALPLLLKAANRGEPRAQYVIGTALFNGDLLPRDLPLAYAYMVRAASAGLNRASGHLAQMDKFISVEDRQKGLVLAKELEARGNRRQSSLQAIMQAGDAGTGAGFATDAVTSAAPVKDAIVAAVPAPVQAAPASAPKPPPEKATPSPSRPAGPAAKTTPSQPGMGQWWVQLGAFSQAAGAKSLWTEMRPKVIKIANVQHKLVASGTVTRLRVGPLASRQAAERLCTAIRADQKPCLVLAP